MRGYISIDLDLSLPKGVARRVSSKEFKVAVTKAYHMSPDRQTVRQQRHRALVEAYSSLPRTLLKKLQHFLFEDCILFGYDCDVDVRFGEKLDVNTNRLFDLDKVLFSG